MTCYLLTKGRLQRQYTLSWLPPDMVDDVVVVCPPDEADAYRLLYPYRVQVTEAPGVGAIRQEVLDAHSVTDRGPYVMFLDDDLRFYVRRDDKPTNTYSPPRRGVEVLQAFQAVRAGFDRGYSFVGLAHRSGANRETAKHLLNRRLYAAWACDVAVARQRGFRTDRLPLMEDFDFQLQWLTAGYDTLTVNWYIQDNSAGPNAAGGCSTYRTPELQRECAHQLEALWPGLVRAVEKRPKGEWFEGQSTRWDVTIQWKKARAQAA